VTPSWRKPVGALGILALTVAWCIAVASLSGIVGQWPALAQLGFYLVTGVVWIAPLGPVLRWMETGRWR
jgi:hypothetical protein